MTTAIAGRKGICAQCGYSGPLTEDGRPLPHGERRRDGSGMVAPGLCPGMGEQAEQQTLFGRPVGLVIEPTETVAKPVVLEPEDPTNLHIGRTTGYLLIRVDNGGVFQAPDGKPMQTSKHGDIAAPRRALAGLLDRNWVVLDEFRIYRLTDPWGNKAVAIYRAWLREQKRRKS